MYVFLNSIVKRTILLYIKYVVSKWKLNCTNFIAEKYTRWQEKTKTKQQPSIQQHPFIQTVIQLYSYQLTKLLHFLLFVFNHCQCLSI